MIRIQVYNIKDIFKDLNDTGYRYNIKDIFKDLNYTGYRYNIKVHLQRPK